MAKILILGGYGYTGRLLTQHLLRQTDAEIVVAGRHLEPAEALATQTAAEFPGRVTARRVDAADAASLAAALADTSLLLVAAPTTQHVETVVQAALDARVDYLDVQLGARKLDVLRSRAAEIERAGLCFITEAGFHPGLPAALVRLAAAHLDRIDSALTAGFLNMGHDLPYSEAVDELMETFVNYQAQVFKNGAWTKVGSYEMRKIDFGGAIGLRSCASMFFEELRDLPTLLPSLREVGFYIAGTHWVTDWVITLIVMAGLKLAPRRGIRPLGRLMWWGMQTFHRPPYTVALKVDATGQRRGLPARFEATIAHPDGYELTAIPVVATLRQVLDGSRRCPGLWCMGHLVEPLRLFADMQAMGATVTTTLRPDA
jgi:saccharopine dehydrogenase (NAD+, L-lysine-forming)